MPVHPRLYTSSDDVPNDTHDGLGRVYILGKSIDGPVKVGIAENARKRIKSIETATGERFGHIWISVHCSNYKSREKDIHEHLKEFRLVGEWFRVPFYISVEVARMYRYDGISRKARVLSLAPIAAKVRAQ